MKPKEFIYNFFGHLSTVIKHRYYVRRYCWKAGLYWQGLVHDLSKFSPTEFWESVRWYDGKISPIDKCKKNKGYSLAWFHHRGKNKHHYEYWCDNFETGFTCVPMPFKYAMEMLCDYIGAGKAYNGKTFTFQQEYEWWRKVKSPVTRMHPQTKTFIDMCLKSLANEERYDDKTEQGNFWKYKYFYGFWNISVEKYDVELKIRKQNEI